MFKKLVVILISVILFGGLYFLYEYKKEDKIENILIKEKKRSDNIERKFDEIKLEEKKLELEGVDEVENKIEENGNEKIIIEPTKEINQEIKREEIIPQINIEEKKDVVEKNKETSEVKIIEKKLSWYKPKVDATWQWQLNGNINLSYDVDIYDVDLFDSSKSLIKSLQGKGKKVICYFSAGSYEDWRDDKDKFDDADSGKKMDGWNERWLDIRSENVFDIMKARIELALEKGCDGVEPDNVDGYANDTGFNLTFDDQIKFNKFLAEISHKNGLAVALKNNLDQIEQLKYDFDFALNEECFEYQECDLLKPFILLGKPVFNVEYDTNSSKREKICKQVKELKFQTLFLPWDLDDEFRHNCD